jgi:hypothetical protein
METTKEESKSVETNSQDVKETVEKEDNFDYKKAREERITKSTERRILKELGEDSFEAVKNKLKDALNFKSELEKERINGHKLKVLESGFDSKYLDFIVYEVSRTKGEDSFDDCLAKFKENNKQYLKRNKIINTSPNLENNNTTLDVHHRMNDFLSRRTNKI